jgi:C4-dicarboxylate transporter DctM subunit
VFITAAIARTPVIEVARALLIFIAMLIVVLFLISYVPQLVLWLPNLVFGK